MLSMLNIGTYTAPTTLIIGTYTAPATLIISKDPNSGLLK